jgi:hypothetical protein
VCAAAAPLHAVLLQAKFLLGVYQQHAADASKLNTALELG